MNIKELADQIEKKAKVNVLALPIGKRFMTRTPNGNMVVIKAGEPWPITPDGSVVMALFQGEDDVRVYTLAAGDEKKGEAAQEPSPPTRYTISKHQPAVFAEIMSGETFIDEIANEWVMVDEGVSTAERERTAAVDFLRENANAMVAVLANKIEAGEHLEKDDEEDDEGKGVVTSAPVVPSSVS